MIDDKIYLDTKSEDGQAVNLTVLRDYFAAKALQGFCVNMGRNEYNMQDVDELANATYLLADAMLEARDKTTS